MFHRTIHLSLAMVVLGFVAPIIAAQTTGDRQQAKPTPTPERTAVSGPIRSSAAYAEILLRKTELQAEIESVSEIYTAENPRLLEMRAELASLDRSLAKVFAVKPTETDKLTAALGKLIVKKASLETELARLSRRYDAEHPEIKRAKRRVEIFDSAIAEILN